MKLRTILSTILTTLLLSTNSTFAIAWVERHAMTSAEFQAERTRWQDAPYGLRPTCISGYETPGGVRYAAIWQKQTSTSSIALHGLTASQFNATNDFYAGNNYLPVFVSGFIAGGVRYYNAIWEHRPAGDSVVVLGVSQSTLDTLTVIRQPQGYTLNHVSTFTDGDVPRYNAIWTRGVPELVNEYAARYGLTSAQYQNAFNALTGAGYRLTAQTVSFDGGAARIAAVFRKPFGVPWWSLTGITQANYAGENWNAYYQGYRPSFVSVHRENGELRFNAVWTHNGGMTPNQISALENTIRADMQSNNIAGLSLAISRNGRLVYAKGFGDADKQSGEWMNPHHRLRIGSVSKTFTAAGVLRLRHTGVLSSLERTVFGPGALLGNRFGVLPYSAREKAVTVRHLLDHTSGWTDDVPFNPDRDAHIGNFLDNFDVTNTPGTAYRYFNDDYVILGRVIEQLSGKSYEQYLKDSVLAPCGVTDMEIGGMTLAERKPREVFYHSTGADPYVVDTEHGDSTGGWIAKPMDMLLFLRRIDGAAANTDILSAPLTTDMQTGSAANMTYGLGLSLGSRQWGHNGALQGTGAMLMRRNDGLAYAMVRNQDAANDLNCWTLHAKITAALDAIPDADWPEYDLFPTANLAFDDWTAGKFPFSLSSHPGLKEDIWGPDANPDRDDLTNALEAAFGSNPLVWNPVPYSSSRIGNDMVLRWRRAVPLFYQGAQLETQVAHTLRAPQIWLPGPPVQTASGVINPVGFTTLETRLPMGNDPRTFLRFRATTP